MVSLRTAVVCTIVWGVTFTVGAAFLTGLVLGWSLLLVIPIGAFLGALVWQLGSLMFENLEPFSDDPSRKLKLWRPADRAQIFKTGHFAAWNKRNYDKWLGPDVQYARHAMAIDADRADFPRVGWESKKAAIETKDREPKWLKQVWFPGCHSDIGGSYPESESRLRDIALDWMVDALKERVPSIQINENHLNRAPDPCGLQHREDAMLAIEPFQIAWKKGIREVGDDFPLHPSVKGRMQATAVAQSGEVKPYRPKQLSNRQVLKGFYDQ